MVLQRLAAVHTKSSPREFVLNKSIARRHDRAFAAHGVLEATKTSSNEPRVRNHAPAIASKHAAKVSQCLSAALFQYARSDIHGGAHNHFRHLKYMYGKMAAKIITISAIG
jgi:hypothetical protein